MCLYRPMKTIYLKYRGEWGKTNSFWNFFNLPLMEN